MRVEARPPRWVALLLGVALLTTSCATLPLPPGDGFTLRNERAVGSSPLQSLPSPTPSKQQPLYRGWAAHGPDAELATMRPETVARHSATSEEPPPGPPSCGGQPLPPGWPDLSSPEQRELLAPFLSCSSPSELIHLQQHVDMPRLVEALRDWDAVRLGALGPMREDASSLLNLKRVSFLLSFFEHFGPARAEVLALFIVDSSYDDDLREMLFLLAQQKQLAQTLKLLPSFRERLEARGLKPSARADRDFRWSDVGRGLARFGRDALSTSPLFNGAGGLNLSSFRNQLPPPYQQVFDTVDDAESLRHFAPANVVLGTFDHMTFGVPLGFYYLIAGTGQGLASLTQGEYEQATRELTPAVLLVATYAGGKGVRAVSEARGATSAGLSALQVARLRARALGEVARQLEVTLGVDGLRELARDMSASREAGRFVAVGGMDAALALRHARGDVAKAQVWLSQRRPERSGSSGARGGAAKNPGPTPKETRAAKGQGTLSSLVDEHVGLTAEVLEARLALAELESTGARLSSNMVLMEKQRPSLDAPPPGALGHPRWPEYVAYYENRLTELRQGLPSKPPLSWAGYENMRGLFARGLAFERDMVALLRADAALPQSLRRFLGDFILPRIEVYVGVWKPAAGLRFADVLVIEQRPPLGLPPRVETFSFKSRDFSMLGEEALTVRMKADAREALMYYGETLDIRRPELKLQGVKIQVQRVRLIYESGALKTKNSKLLKNIVNKTRADVKGVEVLFQ